MDGMVSRCKACVLGSWNAYEGKVKRALQSHVAGMEAAVKVSAGDRNYGRASRTSELSIHEACMYTHPTISPSITFHDFANLVFHSHRPPMFNDEPPRAHKHAQLKILELLLSRLELHLNNCKDSVESKRTSKERTHKNFQTECSPRPGSHPRWPQAQA